MKADDARHGQERGYFAHRKAGQDACLDCMRAHSAAQKRRDMDKLNGRMRMLPALGYHRRIHALMALGWTQTDIATAASWQRREQVAAIRQQASVSRDIARRLDAAWDALAWTTPAATSHRTRVRYWARDNGWPPPNAWLGVDIDDPATIPDPGWTDYADRHKPKADTLEDFDWLISHGTPPHEAAARAGVTLGTIGDYRRRVRGAA